MKIKRFFLSANSVTSIFFQQKEKNIYLQKNLTARITKYLNISLGKSLIKDSISKNNKLKIF